MSCGCGCNETIKSTQGPPGDPGPAGGAFVESLYNNVPAGGADIYNSGSGVTMPVLPVKTGTGTLSYDGVIYVQATAPGLVTITPLNAGVNVDTNIIKSTFPAAFGGFSYLSIPISGSITMTDATAFTINVLGTTAINAKLVSANIKLKQY